MAQNAAGFAFELALETISPVIAETLSKLRALAQWVNSQNLNSCETAQALVGAVWSKNDRASAAICAAIGTRQGIFSDYAAARHGCGADGKRHSTLAAASGPLKDQAPVNVNYAWRAVRASGFLASDRDLGEFAMSISGTAIVTAPVSDGDASGPRIRILEPLALDRRVTEILMEGGGDLPVYRCDTSIDCLNPVLGRLTVPAARGFRDRVAGLLRRLVEAGARRHGAPGRRIGARQSHHPAGLPGDQHGRRLPRGGGGPGGGRPGPRRWPSTCSRSGSRTCTGRSRNAREPWTSPTATSWSAGARGCAGTGPPSPDTATRGWSGSTPPSRSWRSSG